MHLDWTVPLRNLPMLLKGAGTTMIYTLIIFAIAFVISTALAVVRFRRKIKILSAIATVYVEIFRNIPCLVVMFIVYFGLPQFGIILSRNTAGISTVSIVIAAYLTEVIRSGIASVPHGQWEAGRCIGLNEVQTFFQIIYPQALRNVFPAIGNQFIGTLYATSLLSTLDIRELTQQAAILNSDTFRTFEIYTFVTVLYICMSQILQLLLKVVDNKVLTKRG